MFRNVGACLAAIVLLTPVAVGQFLSHSQISLNVFDAYSRQSNGTSDAQTVNLSPTRAFGYLGTFRYSLSTRSAIELNYSHLRNSQNYLLTDSTGFQTAFGINSTVHEGTAAYVYNVKKIYRFNPFAEVGGGVLMFVPTGNSLASTGIGYENQKRLALLYGLGTDFRLTAGFALRLQYRGLLYKAPDFSLSTYTTGAYGHLAEPAAGIVYNF